VTAAPVLRAGRDADAEAFIALIGACWAEYPGCVMDVDGEVPELRALASYYARQGGALWVADHGGQVVGMVGTRPLDDGGWEICKMYADRAVRGAGLAQHLIVAAEGFARDHGGRAMKLWTDTRFDRAHKFYEKQGYVRSGPLRVLNDLSNSIEFAYAKPLAGIAVERLDAAGAASAVAGLAGLLHACVDAGSAGAFAAPLARETAAAFWKQAASEVAAGKRALLVAWADGAMAGAVTLDLAMPANQAHRAGVQHLLVHPRARGRGVERLLMERLEAAARAADRQLLVLDALEDDPALPLYRELGWQETGRIPDFALNGDGALSATLIFWKRV
jgi:GNAT superfamily N-acetyltransferase